MWLIYDVATIFFAPGSGGTKVPRRLKPAHLRRVLVEAAWTYRHRPNVQGRVLRRQKALALSEDAKGIAWKAQQRLCKRFTAMSARGKENNVIAIAIARE